MENPGVPDRIASANGGWSTEGRERTIEPSNAHHISTVGPPRPWLWYQRGLGAVWEAVPSPDDLLHDWN